MNMMIGSATALARTTCSWTLEGRLSAPIDGPLGRLASLRAPVPFTPLVDAFHASGGCVRGCSRVRHNTIHSRKGQRSAYQNVQLKLGWRCVRGRAPRCAGYVTGERRTPASLRRRLWVIPTTSAPACTSTRRRALEFLRPNPPAR